MIRIEIAIKTSLLVLVMAVFMAYDSRAQFFGNGPEETEEAGTNDTNPEEVPVDGGLSLAIAGAIGYGIKKARDLRKKKAK